MPPQWVVVVPVKELHLAKSRLTHLSGEARAELALAGARDVVAAALACPLVVAVFVVTNDLLAAHVLAADGARVIADAADGGLNPALGDGARIASGWYPRAGVAALSADLPGLLSVELAAALTAAAAPRGFVADHTGAGTTLLTALPGTALAPEFGPDSRDRHLHSGAIELQGNWPGLRSDVDTPTDLERATRGVTGRHTAAAWARLGIPG